MRDIRCECGRLLFRTETGEQGKNIEIKCNKCGKINLIKV
jgi:phage FluMu protein Com